MSKELEALEFICKILKEKGIDIKWLFKEQYNTIKQRLEQIDNANPSETLNYLDQFINEMTRCLENPKQYAKNYDKQIFYKYEYTFETVIKQALLKAQEMEKVLKIIFEKNVDIRNLKHYIEIYSDDIALKTYNGFHDKNEELTKEEFDLLKRYCNEQNRK